MSSLSEAERLEIEAEETMALLLAVRSQGVMDQTLLQLFEALPRRAFLDRMRVQGRLGPDSTAPIECGQMQTPPTHIARIVRALDVQTVHTVLEIGTGSGYQSAILARLCRRLYTIDRFRTLVDNAKYRFDVFKLNNISTMVADGELGWREQKGFDRIVVNAALSSVPAILLDQLKPNGILIAPILQSGCWADVVLHRKVEGDLESVELLKSRFLPLIPGVALRL